MVTTVRAPYLFTTARSYGQLTNSNTGAVGVLDILIEVPQSQSLLHQGTLLTFLL